MKQWFPSQLDASNPLANTHRRWSGKLGVWLLLGSLAVMFGLVSLLVFTTPLTRNELGLLGGLKITAPEDTVLFVGDRRVGDGKVDVSWNELLGATGRTPLAVSGQATAQSVAGKGAERLWTTKGPTGVYRGVQDANYSFHQSLYRRPDGLLDHVFLIACEFPAEESDWRELVIPVRARRAENPSSDYFPRPTTQGGGNVSRGMIPSRRDHATFELKLGVADAAWPDEANTHANGEPLWRPEPPTE